MKTIKKNGYVLDIKAQKNIPANARKALFVQFSDTPIGITNPETEPGSPAIVLLFTDNETAWMAHRDLVLKHQKYFNCNITPDTTMRVQTLTQKQLDQITYACIITRQ